MANTGAVVNMVLRVEKALSVFVPEKADLGGCEGSKRGCNGTVMANELAIKVRKAQEALELSSGGSNSPPSYCLYFAWIHLDDTRGDHKSQESHRPLVKITFLSLYEK